MKRFFILILLFTFAFVTNSCSNDDEVNFHFVTLNVLSAEVPESFELNETYQIKVTFERNGNCTFFERFDVRAQDTTVRDVVLIGSVFTDGPCTNDIILVEESFNFVVLYDQPYTFRFFQGTDENGDHQFFEVIVPVN